MGYFAALALGVCGGALCVYILLEAMHRELRVQKAQQDAKESKLEQSHREIETARAENRREIERIQAVNRREVEKIQAAKREFDAQAISYRELQDENGILKRDLRNLDLHVRKLKLDFDAQHGNQVAIDERAKDLGIRYLKDNVKWISASLTQNNFVDSKKRLQETIGRLRGIGFEVSESEEASLHADLRLLFEKTVRAAFEREEQARIKAQIREEQLREKEIERELKQLEREREAIKAALQKALAEAKDQHSEEVERLKARLAEAEARSERAISQAQLTKAGFVYVISNVGSFGEGVYKVGMTRRLDPLDRVRELGDASVPFPFDVHMKINSNDAPALENALHRKLHNSRLNKINLRKEFFRTDFETILEVVTQHHGEVEYVADAEALQFRQSTEMSFEDQEFIASVWDDVDEESSEDSV